MRYRRRSSGAHRQSCRLLRLRRIVAPVIMMARSTAALICIRRRVGKRNTLESHIETRPAKCVRIDVVDTLHAWHQRARREQKLIHDQDGAQERYDKSGEAEESCKTNRRRQSLRPRPDQSWSFGWGTFGISIAAFIKAVVFLIIET